MLVLPATLSIWKANCPGAAGKTSDASNKNRRPEGLEMPKLPILVAATAGILGACAPAPLYTAGKSHKGAVTLGEIPRDARGEPVWAAIRQAPGASQPNAPADMTEGDAAEAPKPPRA